MSNRLNANAADKNFFKARGEDSLIKLRAVRDELPEFADEFFIGIESRTSPLTRLNYAYDLRIFFDYLARKKFRAVAAAELTLADMENLTALDLEKFLEYLNSYEFNGKKLRCTERGKERKICAVRSFFKYFFNKDRLTKNVAAKVDLPKIHDKNIVRLETDEVVKFLNEAESGAHLSARQSKIHENEFFKTRDVALLTLFLGTGIRISECVGLDAKDIDIENYSFTVTRKGGNRVILYFSKEIAGALIPYLNFLDNEREKKTPFGRKIDGAAALFFSSQGRRITVRAVQNLVVKYGKIAAPLKRITPHKLRSTYGTSLYRETGDIYVVAEVLGHKDINTTKRHYAAISEDIKRSAADKVVLRDKD